MLKMSDQPPARYVGMPTRLRSSAAVGLSWQHKAGVACHSYHSLLHDLRIDREPACRAFLIPQPPHPTLRWPSAMFPLFVNCTAWLASLLERKPRMMERSLFWARVADLN